MKVHYLSICVCGKDDQRYSIVFNFKNIYLFPYFDVSLDLYHYLLLSCSNEYFYPVEETISDAYLTDTPSYFPFIEPNISLLPQGSLASMPSNALIFACEASFYFSFHFLLFLLFFSVNFLPLTFPIRNVLALLLAGPNTS